MFSHLGFAAETGGRPEFLMTDLMGRGFERSWEAEMVGGLNLMGLKRGMRWKVCGGVVKGLRQIESDIFTQLVDCCAAISEIFGREAVTVDSVRNIAPTGFLGINRSTSKITTDSPRLRQQTN